MKDDPYDFLIVNDVFELFYDYENAFKETFRVPKPGGKLIFMLALDGNSENTVRRDEIGMNSLEYTQDEWYYRKSVDDKQPRLVC